MERRNHSGLTLDVCANCKGVWFDHAELKSVWSIAVVNVNKRRRFWRGSQAVSVSGDILLESLFWAPGLVVDAGVGVAHGIGHVAGAIGGLSVDGAAHAALGAADVVGGAAEGLFETIMEIIGSIFD
jgi:hypothetical protein